MQSKYYLIWSLQPPETNVAVIQAINHLADAELPAKLREWQERWGFAYPNNSGTQEYTPINQCQNPDSAYFGSTYLELYEKVWESLTPEIVEELVAAGIPLPSEGLPPNAVRQRPADWYLPEE